MTDQKDNQRRATLNGTESESSLDPALVSDHWLIDQLPVGVFKKDRDGRYTFVNAWLCELKRLPAENFIGKSAAEMAGVISSPESLQDPDRVKEVESFNEGAKHHDLIMQTGQTYESEEHYSCINGSERYIHVIKGPLIDRNGVIVGSQGVLLDITGRKQAEAQLANESGMMRALMNYSADAIYFKDKDSRFIRCSAALSALFNLASPDEAVGKRDFDFFDKEHAQAAYDDEQQIIRTGQPVIGKTEKETWPDGRVTWALTSKMPLFDERGAIIGVFGISKDITAIKGAESKLEELNKQLVHTSRQAGMAEVATSVLHNVGNVLNSANVSIMLLLDNARKSKVAFLTKAVALFEAHKTNLPAFLENDPKGQQLPGYLNHLSGQLHREWQTAIAELESLRQNIEHIKEIVTMQQNYAKVSGVAEMVNPADLIEDAVRMNAGALARHEVQLVREYTQVPSLTTDKHKVLQILVNLIRNAKYACDEARRKDKQVRLQVGTHENRVRISIIDNGVGIPPENRTRIFSHGFTTRHDGHGFGLHSGALAATELGGALTVESDGLGKGATFTLELPLDPPKNNN